MMPLQELNACGYPVDVGYQPLTSLSDIDPMESATDFYARSATLTKRLIASHTARGKYVHTDAHSVNLLLSKLHFSEYNVYCLMYPKQCRISCYLLMFFVVS
ncbi:hypothetical protein EG68_08085 [Paragonimus skrjabini miyazakii]|uniref:Uncharacterized protein n=1 Tax=Paragonimus skrjabini miyazakii TaxID=59628 RepID=A0A8S9YXR0_9TREM|nr:hypothetical protein EG68_08085 [Paragonimus skrjabini miyazakii]